MTVLFCLEASDFRLWTSCRDVAESSPEVGSSRMRQPGELSSSMAMESLRRCPPLMPLKLAPPTGASATCGERSEEQ